MIETARLILRPWTEEDRDAYVSIFTEPEAMWFPMRRVMSAEEASAHLDARLREPIDECGYGLWAVVPRAVAAPIGWVGFAEPTWLPEVMPAIEIGWRISKQYWGCGYVTEAARACLQLGFGRLGFERVVCIYEPENVRSVRVAARLGFTLERETTHPAFPTPIHVTELFSPLRRPADRQP